MAYRQSRDVEATGFGDKSFGRSPEKVFDQRGAFYGSRDESPDSRRNERRRRRDFAAREKQERREMADRRGHLWQDDDFDTDDFEGA